MTRSEDGGLEEVVEFFSALAKRSCSSTTVLRRESTCVWRFRTCARRRLQLEQLAFLDMEPHYIHSHADGYPRERLRKG